MFRSAVVLLSVSVSVWGWTWPSLAQQEPQVAGIAFDVDDLTSALGDKLPTLFVYAPLQRNELGELLEGLRLETWPEGTRVASELAADPVPGYSWRLQLRPSQPLQDRWYAVVLPRISSRFRWPIYDVLQRMLPDGRTEVRFRPGSEPRVSWIETCAKGDTIAGAVVLSEMPSLATDVALSVGTSSGCRPASQGGPADRILRFTCTGTQAEEVSLALASAGSRILDGRKIELARIRMKPDGQGCRIGRPTEAL